MIVFDQREGVSDGSKPGRRKSFVRSLRKPPMSFFRRFSVPGSLHALSAVFPRGFPPAAAQPAELNLPARKKLMLIEKRKMAGRENHDG